MLLRTCALALALAIPLVADDEPSVDGARHLAEEGDLAGALATLDKVIAAHPDQAHAWQQRALVHYAMGTLDRAVEDAQKGVELEPKSVPALRLLGAALLRIHKRNVALAEFKMCGELSAGDAAASVGRLAVHVEKEEIDEAVKEYGAALANAGDAEAFRRLLAARLGGHEKSPGPVEEAEGLLAGDMDAVWPMLPRPDEARDLAAKVEKEAHDAGDKAAAVRAAVLVGKATEHPMALAKLKKEEQQDRLRDARSAYLRAIDADKANPAGYVAWAQSFLRSNALKQEKRDPFGGALDYLSEAQDLLETAIKEGGDKPEPHRLLGVVLEEKGNLDTAVEHYEKAIALAPADPVGYGSLAGLYLRRKNDTAKAIDALQRCLKSCPDDAETKLALAFVLLQAGRKDEALAAAKEVFPSVALTHPIDPNGDLAQLLRGVGLLPEK